jgi:hypothetical protein
MPRPKKTKTSVNVLRRTEAVRYAPNPLPALTPANLASYLESFSRGYLRDTSILWDAMQTRDDRVGADAAKRYKSIARHGYKVVYADGVDAKSAPAKRHADAIRFALENMTALDATDTAIRGGASMLCRQMQQAVGFRYRIHEIVWRETQGGLTFDGIATPLWWFERTTGELRYLRNDLDIEGIELEADGWMITVGDGLMAATSLLYLLKRMALSDWALYNGRVGPGIHGETTAPVGSDDWNALVEAVENFGFDLKIVTQSGVKIAPIEMALKGTLPWPEMFSAMQKAITILWRGGNLASDSGGSPDQAGVTLQGDEKEMLEQDDAEAVSDALNDYIVAPLIRYRFGEDPLAWVQWQTGARPNTDAAIKVDDALARRGFPFTAEDLAERYQRTLPQTGQTLLSPPSAAGAPLPAANSATLPDPVPSAAIDRAISAELHARAAAIAPWLDRLQALADKPDLTEPQFLDAFEALVKAMPADLLTPDNIAAIAEPRIAAMLQAVASAAAAAPQRNSP